MAASPKVLPAELDKSIAGIVSTHEAISEGIATHAQKHTARVDEMRAQRKRNLAIADGIRRNVTSV